MSPNQFRVGMDSYDLYPLGLDPLQTLRWAKGHGAEGVQFSGLESRFQAIADRAYLRDLAAYARENGLYLEWGGSQHIPREPGTWAKKELLAINRAAAEQAAALDTRIVRSCSGGLMRWQPDSPMTETLLRETAAAMLSQKQMLIDHNVILAIETHFEFTSFELVRLFERCDASPGAWLGICLDVMNLLTMLEDPVCATRRLLPWVVCTHMKDGGIALTPEGLTTFPVPVGKGVVDLPAILQLLGSLSRNVALSVEDHGGSFPLPIFDPDFLSKFPDLTAAELARLMKLAQMAADRSTAGCRMVEREEWPKLCERRTAGDIAALKEIVTALR
jgi:sugar phosphate isomerase/epimerase